MSRSTAPALAVSHGLLRVLIALNFLAALFLTGLLVVSFIDAPFLMEALGLTGRGVGPEVMGARLIMLAGLISVPLAHVLFTRLLGIVSTVGSGDPFVARNADRLRTCAWALLGLEGMHLLVGAVVTLTPVPMGWDFSPVGLLAVLLLFVLSQVFAQGARMRDDLEGTV